MNKSKAYLALVISSFTPALSGCLFSADNIRLEAPSSESPEVEKEEEQPVEKV